MRKTAVLKNYYFTDYDTSNEKKEFYKTYPCKEITVEEATDIDTNIKYLKGRISFETKRYHKTVERELTNGSNIVKTVTLTSTKHDKFGDKYLKRNDRIKYYIGLKQVSEKDYKK